MNMMGIKYSEEKTGRLNYQSKPISEQRIASPIIQPMTEAAVNTFISEADEYIASINKKYNYTEPAATTTVPKYESTYTTITETKPVSTSKI